MSPASAKIAVLEKKGASLPPLSETLLKPDGKNPQETTMELDEVASFVFKKANQTWVWVALCRMTRQVVAYVVGDRSKETCQTLWNAISEAYQQRYCFTDFWRVYQMVIP